ncbi:MAG TPA: hypothetical protein VM577_02190 [Anaerovoracaceae bacterium]|nr:hypothetical protein [Anaerovoracaceae bacterium]
MDKTTIIVPMAPESIKEFKKACTMLAIKGKESALVERFMEEQIKDAGKKVSTKLSFMEQVKELLGISNTDATQVGLKLNVDKHIAKTFIEIAGKEFISKIAQFCKWAATNLEKYKSLISNPTKSVSGALKALKNAEHLERQKMTEEEIHNRHIASMFGVPYELANF